MKPHTPDPDTRYIAASIIVVLAAIAAALLFVDARVETTLSHEEERAARRELNLLQQIFAESGAAGVEDAVGRRAHTLDQETIVAVKNPDGMIIGGGVTAWPNVQRDDGDWGEITLQRTAGPARAAALLTLFPDGSIALIGNDLSARDRVRRDSLAGFAVALVLVTAIALAAGVQLNRIARQRVAAITRTAEEVMAGRLQARVPARRGRDAFAHLGGVVNEMLERLEALFAAMRAVTDSLAHDLRTPLNRLNAALERAAAASDGRALDEIETAQQEADRLAATFTALIDIARAESGLSEEAMEPVDLKALAEGLTDLFAPIAEDRGLSLKLEADPVTLRAHRPLLSQALANLIDNAIKFAPPGGIIAISLKGAPDGAEFVVADQGAGIPDADRPRAGERFVRFAPSGAGSGLGLSIAAATARLHRGELKLEDNRPGLRATLHIRTRTEGE